MKRIHERVTGVLRNAQICRIVEMDTSFIFGYVVRHKDPSFQPGFWFATSYIVEQEKCPEGVLFTTANSLYLVERYDEIDVPLEALSSIRSGTPPKAAIEVLNSHCAAYKDNESRSKTTP